MLNRFVRMTFQPEKVEEFLNEIFIPSKEKIRHFSGCHHLELMRDLNEPNIFMTFSKWESPEALETYRHSELFKSTWAKTKVLFADKPKAWSVETVISVD